MVRRWEEELLSHVTPLQICALDLGIRKKRVKARKVGRLSAGSIQVVKHSYAISDSPLDCDLLIIDEAHRAKGEDTAFSAALKQQKKYAHRVLILTATPFSIRLEELEPHVDPHRSRSVPCPRAILQPRPRETLHREHNPTTPRL